MIRPNQKCGLKYRNENVIGFLKKSFKEVVKQAERENKARVWVQSYCNLWLHGNNLLHNESQKAEKCISQAIRRWAYRHAANEVTHAIKNVSIYTWAWVLDTEFNFKITLGESIRKKKRISKKKPLTQWLPTDCFTSVESITQTWAYMEGWSTLANQCLSDRSVVFHGLGVETSPSHTV